MLLVAVEGVGEAVSRGITSHRRSSVCVCDGLTEGTWRKRKVGVGLKKPIIIKRLE